MTTPKAAEYEARRNQRHLVRILDYVTEIGDMERLPTLVWEIADGREIVGRPTGSPEEREYADRQWSRVLEQNFHSAGPNNVSTRSWVTHSINMDVLITLGKARELEEQR